MSEARPGSASQGSGDGWEAWLDVQQARFLAELTAFLSIPSISAEPAHEADVRHAASWVAERLTGAGLEHVEILPTGGHPAVYADWLHRPGAPTILIYGHFDVQPAAADGWTSPPFEPRIAAGRIYARGASDDKGNMLVPILAVEALLRTTGHLPLNLKFLFEGEEEILSPDMPAFIQANRARLACDLVVSADGWQWSETESDLRVGLRGVCSLEIDVTGPLRDLHAGSHGGAVANPIHALTAMLASLRDAEGRIQVPGFLDRVRPLTAAERASLASIPFDEEAYRTGLGVPALAGEPGFSPRERIGTRPTIEVNGIWGGYAGPGVKTIVPASAHAKLTCRLVADQRPDESAAAVVRHLERAAPLGVRATVRILPNAGWPYEASADHPGYRAARDVLVGLYGREPYYTRSGGSIPIVSLFHQELGVPTVIFGFGLPDENFHAPEEFFRLASFRRGQTAYVRLLLRLGDRESWKTA